MKYRDKNGGIHDTIFGLISSSFDYGTKKKTEEDIIEYDDIVGNNSIVPYDQRVNIQFVKHEIIMINFKDKMISIKYNGKIRSCRIPNDNNLYRIITELLYYTDKLI